MGRRFLALLVFLLEDDLREHRAGDVFAGFGVVDHEVFAGLDHGGEVFERHIGAGAGVVEAPIGVLLNGDRLCSLTHRVRLGHRFWHGITAVCSVVKIGAFGRNGYRFVRGPFYAGPGCSQRHPPAAAEAAHGRDAVRLSPLVGGLSPPYDIDQVSRGDPALVTHSAQSDPRKDLP